MRADGFIGALRATEFSVATNMAMIRILETSIFNLKKKICQELVHFNLVGFSVYQIACANYIG